jgi:hypothetical protein
MIAQPEIDTHNGVTYLCAAFLKYCSHTLIHRISICFLVSSFIREALSRRKYMKLNAPTQAFWLISVILGGLGILTHFVRIQTISVYSFELLALGFVLLVIATVVKKA